MTPVRFALVLVVALTIEGAVFAALHQDLIYLGGAVEVLVRDESSQFEEHSRTALERPRLTRRTLETIAEAAWLRANRDLALRSLRRLVEEYPREEKLRLRLADHLRLAGRITEAQAIYGRLLVSDAPSQGSAR